MKASIIIRCYNEGKYLKKLLDGITQQTYKNYEIVIVDSESDDNTISIISQYPVVYKKIKRKDFTFGYSLNVGCRAASGEVFINVSAHTYPLGNNWLEEMLKPFVDEKVAIVYGKQRGDFRNNYVEHRIFESWFPDNDNTRDNTFFCNNANCAIRRSHWEKHLYDEKVTGLEDLDIAKKISERGFLIKYAPEACIIHVHEEGIKKIYRRYYREALALRHILPSMSYSIKDFLLGLYRNISMDIKQSIKDGCFKKNITSILMIRIVQFWATYRGHGSTNSSDNYKELKKILYAPAPINKNTLNEHTKRK